MDLGIQITDFASLCLCFPGIADTTDIKWDTVYKILEVVPSGQLMLKNY